MYVSGSKAGDKEWSKPWNTWHGTTLFAVCHSRIQSSFGPVFPYCDHILPLLTGNVYSKPSYAESVYIICIVFLWGVKIKESIREDFGILNSVESSEDYGNFWSWTNSILCHKMVVGIWELWGWMWGLHEKGPS